MLPLKILSFNVAGMADPDKRALVFRFLRDHPAHVICLQEVHAPDDSSFWSVHWGGPASWNWYTAILFSPSLGKPQFDVSHGDASYLQHFASKGKSLRLPTFTLMPIVLIVLPFLPPSPPLPIFTPLMTFWLVIGMPIRTLSVIAVLRLPSSFSKLGLICFRCSLRLRTLLSQVLLPPTIPFIRLILESL